MEESTVLNFPVYGYDVHIIYTDDIQFARQRRNQQIGAMDSLLGPYVDGLHSYNKMEPVSYIFFSPLSSTGTITHECFHAIHRMWKYIGAKHENEVTAYHLGYLVDKVLNFKNSF